MQRASVAQLPCSPMHARRTQVACALLLRFGQYSVGAKRKPRSSVFLPSRLGELHLMGDIRVPEGLELRLAPDGAGRFTVILGSAQLRVALGGRLELTRLSMSGATGEQSLHRSLLFARTGFPEHWNGSYNVGLCLV